MTHTQLLPLLNTDRFLTIGLMSGTSVDGVDAALCEIVRHSEGLKVDLMQFDTFSYSDRTKQRILALCKPETSSIDDVCAMNVELGEQMAKAAIHIAARAGVPMQDIDFVSSHGQTVYHMPKSAATLQIGELAVIANRTGCVTVGDFRPSDMAAGGQGAPLVPFVDQLLFGHETKGRLLLNIGGISNGTVVPATSTTDVSPVAFDIGPGNVLIDEVMRIGTNGSEDVDKGGQIASAGKIAHSWLAQIMQNDAHLFKPYPKSTGREHYTRQQAEQLYAQGVERGLSFEDIVATVTYYTVQSIVWTVKHQLNPVFTIDEVFVGGGGVHNRFLMNRLGTELAQPVQQMEALNVSSDAKEAIAFGILGARFMWGQTNNLPSATGANEHVIMGKLVLPV